MVNHEGGKKKEEPESIKNRNHKIHWQVLGGTSVMVEMNGSKISIKRQNNFQIKWNKKIISHKLFTKWIYMYVIYILFM